MATKKIILLLTDFTKIADRAAEVALKLAVGTHADLLIYNSIISIETSVVIVDRIYASEEINKKTLKSIASLKLLANQLQSKLSLSQQAKINIMVKEGLGSPVETILNLVAKNNIWMVVMGNHIGGNTSNWYFDSNVPTVMNNCGCPLLLVP